VNATTSANSKQTTMPDADEFTQAANIVALVAGVVEKSAPTLVSVGMVQPTDVDACLIVLAALRLHLEAAAAAAEAER
jgi:predicted pyridoxine 5'-phosphate oxidase superfamily flavin-nucleotide-binding protein